MKEKAENSSHLSPFLIICEYASKTQVLHEKSGEKRKRHFSHPSQYVSIFAPTLRRQSGSFLKRGGRAFGALPVLGLPPKKRGNPFWAAEKLYIFVLPLHGAGVVKHEKIMKTKKQLMVNLTNEAADLLKKAKTLPGFWGSTSCNASSNQVVNRAVVSYLRQAKSCAKCETFVTMTETGKIRCPKCGHLNEF